MGFAKLRLFAVVGLLLAWLGYIAYQALSVGRFPVVSHSQLLVSTLDVIADVRAGENGRPSPKVLIQEVHWPPAGRNLVGREVEVANLADPTIKGFAGPGRYILPLVEGEGGAYRVAPLPPSPGFDGDRSCFVYPDTQITRRQLDEVPKPSAHAGSSSGIE